MLSTKLVRTQRFFIASAFLALSLVVAARGQDDPDPNSPTPVLITEKESTRAVVAPPSRLVRNTLPASGQLAFAYNTKATIYVSNIVLMEGEGAGAFRVNVEDSKGRKYQFPVLALQQIKGDDGLYALTVRLKDDIGFWEPPAADGDVLIAVAWRGLSSNRARLGLGTTGGAIKDDPDATPMPRGSMPRPLAVLTDAPGVKVPTAEYGTYNFVGDRKRFLEQATFGPTVALDQRLRRIGLRTWLAEQLEAPYPSLNSPYPDIPLKSTNTADTTLGCGPAPSPSTLEYRVCIRDHYSMYPVQKWFYTEALYGDAQLRHRVAWALAQMWVIAAPDTQQSSWMIAYHKVLSQNAFGNYRTLMKEMTLNPAMGNYLDMARSTRNNPNENYAREVMQLFTVGLFMLNQDGTLQRDASNNPVPTYTQDTVNNMTKVLTGWSFCNTTCPNSAPGIVNYKDPMIVVNTNNHDLTAKTLLTYPGSTTTNVAACTGCTGAAITAYANNSLEQALDNIYQHPNVAPFVSKYLIQHLVTSNPSPAYVGRISAVFNANRSSSTQMKEVVRAILLDPEARGDVKTDPNYGKLREPVQMVTNLARRFDVKSAALNGPSDGVVNNLAANIGQSTFQSPTVFNFYPPDYVIPGTALPGPEFAIMTTSTSIGRANLGNTLVYSQIGVSENAPAGTKLDFAEMQALVVADPTCNRLLDVLNARMLHGTMSAQMRASILTAVTSIVSTNTLARAQSAVYLVATSSQYQIQR